MTCCEAQASVSAIHHIEVCGNKYERSFRPFAFKIPSKSNPKARRGPAADHRVNKDHHVEQHRKSTNKSATSKRHRLPNSKSNQDEFSSPAKTSVPRLTGKTNFNDRTEMPRLNMSTISKLSMITDFSVQTYRHFKKKMKEA